MVVVRFGENITLQRHQLSEVGGVSQFGGSPNLLMYRRASPHVGLSRALGAPLSLVRLVISSFGFFLAQFPMAWRLGGLTAWAAGMLWSSICTGFAKSYSGLVALHTIVNIVLVNVDKMTNTVR